MEDKSTAQWVLKLVPAVEKLYKESAKHKKISCYTSSRWRRNQ
jgi:hypothetical protein